MRIIRFFDLLVDYFRHVWYASQYKYTVYILHGTDEFKEHIKTKKMVKKLMTVHPSKAKFIER